MSHYKVGKVCSFHYTKSSNLSCNELKLSLWYAWEYSSLFHLKNKVNWLQNMSCRLDFPFLTLHTVFFWLSPPLPIWYKLCIYQSLLEDVIMKCIALSFFLRESRARFCFSGCLPLWVLLSLGESWIKSIFVTFCCDLKKHCQMFWDYRGSIESGYFIRYGMHKFIVQN